MNRLPTGLSFFRRIHEMADGNSDVAATLARELGCTTRTVGSWIATANN
ncbi:MAG: hypothetical protein MR654_09305 [Corynebacterium glucuronolyticum]|nr:hypothetical protein [Corynebacterium glucuronolyticum]